MKIHLNRAGDLLNGFWSSLSTVCVQGLFDPKQEYIYVRSVTVTIRICFSPSSCSFSPSDLWSVSIFTAPFPSEGWLLALLVSMGTQGGDRSGELHVLTSVVVLVLDEWSLWPLLHTYTQAQTVKLRLGKPQVSPVSLWCFRNQSMSTWELSWSSYTYSSAALKFLISSLSLLFSFFKLFISPAATQSKVSNQRNLMSEQRCLICIFHYKWESQGFKRKLCEANAISQWRDQIFKCSC